MTAFMIIVVIALFLVLIGFTWYRLEALDGVEKIVINVAGLLLSWLITNILFSISARGITYADIAVKNEISKILVLVFTPINGIAIMPYLAKIISQVKFEEINMEEAVKKVLILIIILIIVFFIEVNYLTRIQMGIFDIANSL